MESKPAQQRLGLHIYLYCCLAVLFTGVACFVIAGVILIDRVPIGAVVEGCLAAPALYLAALWFALRRCSSADLSGSKGLLLMTAYMTVGIGGFSMLIAIPAVMLAIIACIGIALGSLLRVDRGIAVTQFQRLVAFYYRHRMYQ